ncbi:MAG: CPBP family intramembrane glutamic endopeptidase [Gemmatimonadales bacterium]
MDGRATSARSRIGAVAWSLGFILVGYSATGLLGATVYWLLLERLPAGAVGYSGAAVIQVTVGLLVFGALTWAIGRKALGLDWRTLGFVSGREGIPGFGKGLAVGALVGAGALVLSLGSGSGWVFDGGTVAQYLGRVLILALVLLPAAFMEELAFRGAAVAGMARGIGRGSAIVVTAVLFAAAHRTNPSVTVLALGNIALAGVLLGLTFFARGGLWTATGAHLGWNVALAALAAPVSGLPFEIPWIDFVPGEPAWVTGGAFGPEGGVLATVMLTVGIVLVVRWRDFREAS